MKPKLGHYTLCTLCGKNIYVQPNKLKKHLLHFCNFQCHNMYQGRNKLSFNCKMCNAEFKWSKSRLTQSNPTYCSINCRNSDTKHMESTSLKGNMALLNLNGLNKLELKGNDILNDIGIEYATQVKLFDKFLVDVLIESKKLIIHWDGEYWHTKPRRKLLDISQDAYLHTAGYSTLRITDIQIKTDIKKVYEIIRAAIQ